ncbi:phosphate ABC transporter permease PstA [Bacillus sp. EAC]|uniref:phosphate ABC transporter permease PstA n=1 Tax=Bacillus sp. EAC TaxID=1978338 RepID=UPI00211AFD3A|nr:phosphate ABC transporter permease PstA [Bacillus sp. EAC]
MRTTPINIEKSIKKNRTINKVIKFLLSAITVFSFSIILFLLLKIISKGLFTINIHFLTGLPEEIDAGGGVGPFLFNTFYVLLISLVISIPIALGAGIYLAEYAKKNKMTEWISTCVEALASVPSLVFGLFGYVLFVEVFDIGLTVIGAAITLSFLNLPALTRITEESIRNVPLSYREAAYSLGASKATCILTIILPAALKGIFTGISLTACRALGESAVILLVGGTSASDKMWDFSLTGPGATLPVQLWYIQSEALVDDARKIADQSAAILVIIILLLSLILRLPFMFKKYKQ